MHQQDASPKLQTLQNAVEFEGDVRQSRAATRTLVFIPAVLILLDMILPERWAKHLHSVYTGTLILVGLTLLGATLLLLGIIAYISIEEPKRLVAYNQTEIVLAPQPAEVFSHQTNLWIILPPISAIFNGMVTNAAVWVRGERFASGPAAALYLLRHSWLIIALGMMAAVAGWFELRRWRRRPKQESQMPAGDLRKGSENVRISGEG